MSFTSVRHAVSALLMSLFVCVGAVADELTDTERDILVTFENLDARVANGGLGAPYRNRKRYSIGRTVRRDSASLMAEYDLQEIDHWPIRSLSVYCFVYRVPDGADRSAILERLNSDARVESAQPLQRFETSIGDAASYDDAYAKLQYSLDMLDLTAAHQASLGAGIRIAIVDSHADERHEDLKGRIAHIEVFSNQAEATDMEHGTAVASVIGARSNNAVGIVGIAPEASLDMYVGCWSDGPKRPAICDSFSLSKALDAILADPPHVLNISLIGPRDPLLERLLSRMLDANVVVVAAAPSRAATEQDFPASMSGVIAVASSAATAAAQSPPDDMLYAPGDRIIVAVPTDSYDFRSGSSLAAAHVSGVAALILSRVPQLSAASLQDILRRSQGERLTARPSINACAALDLAGLSPQCGKRDRLAARTEYE